MISGDYFGRDQGLGGVYSVFTTATREKDVNSDLKTGVFARVKSPLIDLIHNLDTAHQSDDRLQKMQGMTAGGNACQAASAISVLSGRAGSSELFRAEERMRSFDACKKQGICDRNQIYCCFEGWREVAREKIFD